MPRSGGNMFLAFLLLALLIFGAYYVGLATDINALLAGLVRLGNMLSGRNASGNFSGYPANAPTGVVNPPAYS